MWIVTIGTRSVCCVRKTEIVFQSLHLNCVTALKKLSVKLSELLEQECNDEDASPGEKEDMDRGIQFIRLAIQQVIDTDPIQFNEQVFRSLIDLINNAMKDWNGCEHKNDYNYWIQNHNILP